MREQVLRSTMRAVVVAVLVITWPVLAILGWMALVGVRPAGLLEEATTPAFWWLLLLAFAVLIALAFTVSVLVARLQAGTLAEPLTRLAVQANQFRAGEARFEALDTGVAEVDEVSGVLAESAREMTRSLAAERGFAADASHQLRTPLAALLLRLEEIGSTGDWDVVHEETGNAIAQVERLTGVVDDLLGRTRRPKQVGESVSLDSVIASLQREWQPAFAQARRSMHVHGERGLRVHARRVALSQILSTLIENSLAHGTGTLSVSARRSGPSVVVEVSDQGIGIATDLAPRVFERSVSSTGSGLGLALARDLAESDYGRLELVSAQPAVFALFLSEATTASPANTTLR